jgi:hypothetical protein
MKILQIILLAIVLCLTACNEAKIAQQDEMQLGTTIQEMQETTQQITLEKPVAIKISLETANLYVPNNFKIVVQDESVSLFTGDFNGDKIEDFVMMVASNDMDDYQDAKDVRIIICEGNGEKFTEKARSGNIGEFFTNQAPGSQLSLTKSVISLTYQGMRYDYERKYRFEKKYNDYMLIGSENNYYGNATNDGSGNVSTNYLAGVRLENLNEWDEEKRKLIKLPESKIIVSKTLIPLSALNENNFSDL